MSVPEIKVMENGPNVIKGTFTYTGADGRENTTPGKVVALCRCGNSATKPFCDGSHSKTGFQAPGVVLRLKE